MGLFSSIGNMLNDITGASSAAKQSYKWDKEFAQNAHQWETEDLKKAGLNPILSANGSSAGAIASGASGMQAGGTMALSDIMNSASGIAKTISDMDLQDSQMEVNDSTIGKNNAETAGISENNKWITKQAKQSIAESQTRAGLNSAKAAEAAAQKDKIIAETDLTNTENEIKKGGKSAEIMGTEALGTLKNSAKEIGKALGVI